METLTDYDGKNPINYANIMQTDLLLRTIMRLKF